METRSRDDGRIEFRVLGPLEVDVGQGPISLGGPKQRAVLANLVIRANQVVPAETLIDEIWGDEPPEGARHTLQTYVSNLRGVVGELRLQHRPPGYLLRIDQSDLDAWRFDALVRNAKQSLAIDPVVAIATLDDALRLWRGPALADVAHRASLLAEAARLDDQRWDAMQSRIQALLASGASALAIGELETLVAREPLRENLWSSLMLALYREGRQADALAAFQRAREMLADELGIDPSPELAKLQESILRHDPDLEPRGEALRGYRLLETVGEGPTGTVFRAIQPYVSRDVAVKVFHEHIAVDPAFVRRFEPEAQAVAALEHPHIVPVYDYWREPGRAFLVSRYLRGGSLHGLLERDHVLPARSALRMLEQIASALAFVHRQGMVHGDLLPANVLLDAEGNAYLADLRVGTGITTTSPRSDVEGLARLAVTLLGTQMPPRLAALVDRAEAGVEVPDAAAIAAAARGVQEPDLPVTEIRGSRNPYKGLRAFTEAERRDFFGRASFVERLLTRLNETGPGSRFLAVVGPSGSGKSSTLQAGLVPAIRGGGLRDADEPSVVGLSPGVHPYDELASALLTAAVRPVPRLQEVLEDGPRGLLDAVDLIAEDRSEIVIVIDQFEELFTLVRREEECEQFLEALRVATMDPRSRVRVILALRADFFDRPLAFPRFGELLAERTEAVPPLLPDELEQAIREPSEREGVRATPGLVAEIIADVAHERGALPMLQFALTELFERRSADRLTIDAYREVGGIGGALSARAEHSYQATNAEGRRAIKQVLLRLVTLGEGRPDTRRRVPVASLRDLEVDASAVATALETFGRDRFLTFDRDAATREPTVEVAHEALLGAWARLLGWIDAAREDLRWEHQLARASADWQASGQDPSFLLRGARLEQFESWARATDLAIDRRTRAYLKASVDERDQERIREEGRRAHEASIERRSRNRMRALVAVFAVAALVGSSLTIVATNQNARAAREQRAARAAGLAAASVSSLEADPELSILLALRAVDATRAVDGTVLSEAEDALHRAIGASRVVETLPGVGGAVSWGEVIATENPDVVGAIDLRDQNTGDIVHTIDVGSAVTDLASEPEGPRIAATTRSGSLAVWDGTSGARIVEVGGRGPATGVSFGRNLVAAAWSREGVVKIVEVSSHSVIATLRVRRAVETSLSPDGRSIAVGHEHRISVFDVASRGLVRRLTTSTGNDLRYPVRALAWSPNGHYLASASTFLDVWEMVNGRSIFSKFGGGISAAWSPDSSRVAVGTFEGTVRVWVLDSFDPAGDLTLSATEFRRGVSSNGVAFSPDGDRLIGSSEDRSAAKVWDVSESGDSEGASISQPGYYGDVAFMPDGRQVLTIGPAGRVVGWDPETGELSDPIGPVIGDFESSFDLTADGRSVAFAYDKRISAWDVDSGRRLFARRFPHFVSRVDWSPDGRYLAVPGNGGEPGVTILDRRGDVVQTLPVVGNVARFGPDGRLIAILRGSEVQIWDWRQSSVVQAFPATGWELAFDPTGRSVVTNGFEGSEPPQIWDVATGTLRAQLVGHTADVMAMAFSPDGAVVATGGGDDTVRLWDSMTGQELLVLDGHPAGVRGLSFSPDGSKLASHSPTLARVWALDIDDLISVASRNVTRQMTVAECQRFLQMESCPV